MTYREAFNRNAKAIRALASMARPRDFLVAFADDRSCIVSARTISEAKSIGERLYTEQHAGAFSPVRHVVAL